MNLLGAVNYDPVGGAVSKVTTSLLAMTAFDTTNLRIAFTVPAHGIVTVKMTCIHHGSTTTAQVFLGCLEGSTLRGRAPVTSNLLGTAVATTRTKLDASFTLTGLTPGAVNWDAAYGVEIVSSSNGAIKYGGPNDTTTDNAFGGFNFEIWDPKPAPTNFGLLSIDASGRVDVIKVAGTTQTAGDIIGDTNDIQARLPATLVSGRIDASVGAMAANVLTATAINADAITAAKVAADVTTEIQNGLATAAALATVQADTDNIQTRLPAALSGDGFMKADLLSIGDELVSGNNATLKLKQLNIQNSTDNAFVISATAGGIPLSIQASGGAGQPGVSIIGDYTAQGDGIDIIGDFGISVIGYGTQTVNIESAGTNTDGVKIVATGTGKSINAPQNIAVSDGNLTLAAIANAVWTNATRTLTAISDSAGITTLLTRIGSALNISGGKVESNVKQINGTDVTGDGSGTPWGPA